MREKSDHMPRRSLADLRVTGTLDLVTYVSTAVLHASLIIP